MKNDLISRQAAIELAMQYCPDDDGTCSKADEDIRNLLDELEALPSAQPELIEKAAYIRGFEQGRTQGNIDTKAEKVTQDRPEPVKWLKDEFGSRCGACGRYAYRDKFGKPWESDFCPNCGEKMEVEQ